jgi:biopolymer transport protein ExbD
MLLTKPRPTAVLCKIDVTAFAGILLALLFMFLAQPVLQANLSSAGFTVRERIGYMTSMPHDGGRDAARVAITRNGKLLFGESSITLSELTRRLQDDVRENPDLVVYIRIDERTRYGFVKQVLNRLQAARIPEVAFSRAYR